MQGSESGTRRPLEGLRVVDLSQVVSGAVTSMLLADFGAEVIKVEPLAGEPYRNSGYRIEGEDGGATNLNILRFTRGKKSVAVDLKSEEGRRLVRGLVRESQILVENFRPGVADRLGLDKESLKQVNPDLIYASISGFGHDDLFASPYRDRPAYAIITEAMAGLMHLAGDGEGAPVWMGFAMADIFAGTLAFAGVLLAILDRDQQAGRRVDVAMYDGALLMNDLAIAAQSLVGMTFGGGQYMLQSPWGPFETADGYVAVAVLTDRQWKSLCEVIGRPELGCDERLDTGLKRSQNHAELVAPVVGEWSRGRGKDECADLLLAAGVPAAPVRTTVDVLECPAAEAREMLVEISNDVIGHARVVGNPIKLDGAPDGAATHVPGLGENTREVLGEVLDLDEEEIDELLAGGVVAGARPAATRTGR